MKFKHLFKYTGDYRFNSLLFKNTVMLLLFSLLPLGSELVGLFLVALWFLAGMAALLLETAMNRSSRTGRDYLYGRLSGTRLASTVLRQPPAPTPQA